MNASRKIIIPILTILAITIFFFGYMLVKSYFIIKENGVNLISKEHSSEFSFKNASVSLLPWPKMIIMDSTLGDKATVEKIEAHFSIYSMLKSNPKISNLYVKNADFISGNQSFSGKELLNYLSELASQNHRIDLDNVNLLNSNRELLHHINNLSIISKSQKEYEISGIVDGNSTVKAAVDGNADKMLLNLTSDNSSYSVAFNGTFDSVDSYEGTCNLTIQNVVEYLSNHYVIQNHEKEQNNAQLQMSFNLSVDKGVMLAKNIVLNSSLLEGKGDIKLFLNASETGKIDLDLNKVNFSEVLSNFSFKDLPLLHDKLFSALLNINSDAQIKIKELSFFQEKINDVNYVSTVSNDILGLQDFSGKIDSGGEFKLSGNVTRNSYRSMLKGVAEIKHQDFNNLLRNLNFANVAVAVEQPIGVRTAIEITPVEYNFQEIDGHISDTQFNGDVVIKLVGDIPRINANLKILDVDLHKTPYPILSPCIEYLKTLGEDIQEQNYLTKFVPINTVNYEGDLHLDFKNLFLSNQTLLNNLVTEISLSSSRLVLNNFYISKGDEYITGRGSMVSNSLKPEIKLEINEGVVRINSANEDTLFSYLHDVKNKLAYDKFKFALNMNLNQLFTENQVIENLSLALSTKDRFIDLSNLSFKEGISEFVTKGSILLRPLSLNLVYAYNSFNLPKLSFILGKNFTAPEGLASIRGSMASYGETYQDIRNNCYLSSEFIAKNVVIDNFSPDDLVAKIVQDGYQQANLEDDKRIASSSGNMIIEQIAGKMQLDKGLLVFNDMALNTKLLIGKGVGKADLKAENFDFLFNLDLDRSKKTVDTYKAIDWSLDARIYGNFTAPVKLIEFHDRQK